MYACYIIAIYKVYTYPDNGCITHKRITIFVDTLSRYIIQYDLYIMILIYII